MIKTIYNKPAVNSIDEKIKIQVITAINHNRLFVITYCDLTYIFTGASEFYAGGNWFYTNIPTNQYEDMYNAIAKYAYI